MGWTRGIKKLFHHTISSQFLLLHHLLSRHLQLWYTNLCRWMPRGYEEVKLKKRVSLCAESLKRWTCVSLHVFVQWKSLTCKHQHPSACLCSCLHLYVRLHRQGYMKNMQCWTQKNRTFASKKKGNRLPNKYSGPTSKVNRAWWPARKHCESSPSPQYSLTAHSCQNMFVYMMRSKPSMQWIHSLFTQHKMCSKAYCKGPYSRQKAIRLN